MFVVERERPDFPKTVLGLVLLTLSMLGSLYCPGPGVNLFSTISVLVELPNLKNIVKIIFKGILRKTTKSESVGKLPIRSIILGPSGNG